ncbi:MAG TPA: class II aldolase/adducin family protein [Candidatus Acidoferrales bacterium]|nr:class II aldolase/adducin family protein [Candidatus Acidoferrales bacterium]
MAARARPTQSALREDVVAACKILSRQGLVEGFGHVSARVPGSELFILTPRMSLELVEAGDLLLVNLAGAIVKGEKAPPFEAPLHAAIYRARSDVGAIARFHGRKANYFGATRKTLHPVHNHGSFFFGGVPVFPKSDLITTASLAEELAATLGKKRAVLLRGNGQVTVGDSVAAAVIMAIYLEETADIYYGALQIGAPVLLSREQARSRRQEILSHIDLERAWNFFKAKAAEASGPRR